MEVRKLFISFILVALFTFALISFSYNFMKESNSNSSILNDSRINSIYTGLNDTIFNYGDGGIQEQANGSFNSFTKDDSGSILSTIGSFFISSIVGLTKGVMGIILAIFSSIWTPLLQALGIPREIRVVVGTVISTILLISITLLAWKLYKQGN